MGWPASRDHEMLLAGRDAPQLADGQHDLGPRAAILGFFQRESKATDCAVIVGNADPERGEFEIESCGGRHGKVLSAGGW